jgi:hypothetical protein
LRSASPSRCLPRDDTTSILRPSPPASTLAKHSTPVAWSQD